jgi:predicted Zn-dependent peptidase
LAEKSRRSWGEAGKEPLRVVLVNKPGAVQTVIRFFTRGPKYASPDRVRLQMLNTILGGSFTSRLNQNLRERHGYTYGARSRFAMEPSTGYFSAGADVQTEHTGAALREFLSEFGRLRGGDVTAEETAKSRQTNRLELVRSFEGQEGLVSTACLLDRNGLPFATLGEDLAAMERVTHEELNRLARPAIPLEHGLVVLVGDKAAIAPQLAGLDLPPPVEVSPRGTPLPPATGPAE